MPHTQREPRLYRAIGFPVDDLIGEANLAMALHQSGLLQRAEIPGGDGYYLRGGPHNGVEIWQSYDAGGQPLGMSPHFFGLGRLRLDIQKFWPDQTNRLCGYVFGEAMPLNEEEQPYPLVVELPAYAIVPAEMNEIITALKTEDADGTLALNIQVSGFAFSILAFDSAEEYLAEGPRPHSGFTAQDVVPLGMLDTEAVARSGPSTASIISGCVERMEYLDAPIGDAKFLWLDVRTKGGWIDVVADPAILEGNVAVGSTIVGEFWLTGRLMPDTFRRQFRYPESGRLWDAMGDMAIVKGDGTEHDISQFLSKPQKANALVWGICSMSFAMFSLGCMLLSPFAFIIACVSMALTVKQRGAGRWLSAVAILLSIVGLVVIAVSVAGAGPGRPTPTP